jgi:hypothetical protein
MCAVESADAPNRAAKNAKSDSDVRFVCQLGATGFAAHCRARARLNSTFVMAKAKAAPVATPMDLIWNDGVVPAWLGGMTLAFIALFPILRTMFPKTCKQRGAFLLAFELVAAVPVRQAPRIRGARVAFARRRTRPPYARRREPRPRTSR